MGGTTRPSALVRAAVACGGLALVLTACTPNAESAPTPAASQDVTPTPSPGETVAPSSLPGAYAVAVPPAPDGPLLTSDVLITGSHELSDRLVRRVSKIKGIAGVARLGIASLSTSGRTLNVASVDLASYRRFAPPVTAQSDVMWERVAGGEVALDPSVSKKLVDGEDMVRLGNQSDAPRVHVGAFAPLSKHISAVVNVRLGDELGIPVDNALLVSTGRYTPSFLMKQLKRAVGHEATIQTLALEFNVDVPQTAVLSGRSVSSSVGSFTYVPHANGTITPDPSWVRSYIRTEHVPILGTMTCNKAIFPQLRAALTEIKQRGLASAIHPNQYGGCYYPRFIARNPAYGLSLHSWGIAFDLNVPENLRGTRGRIDPQVVTIFKRWGFAWGGDWAYTDPMHFELAKIVRPTS